jgi:hypothetical protein
MATSHRQTVIHLLDWDDCGPPAAWSIAALRAHDRERSHRVLLLGTRADAALASQWLPGPIDAIGHRPSATPLLPIVRRPVPPAVFATREPGAAAPLDDTERALIVAWSWRAATMYEPQRSQRMLGCFLRPAPARALPWQRLPDPASVCFASADAQRRSGGAYADTTVLPLPVPERTQQDIHDCAAHRATLDGVPAGRWAFVGVGWPERAISATRISYLAGVLQIGGHPSAALIPQRASDFERATRFAHRHNDAWSVHACNDADPRPCAAADMAVWCGHPAAMLALDGRLPDGHRIIGHPPLAESLLYAIALGVPFVAESVPATRELLAGTSERVLTPVGDRLAMNRAAYAILTDADGARGSWQEIAGFVRAQRPAVGFAQRFGQWLESRG